MTRFFQVVSKPRVDLLVEKESDRRCGPRRVDVNEYHGRTQVDYATAEPIQRDAIPFSDQWKF